MPALPARGAFGLRGRIVGVVLITAIATLAVAALALLGPLEQSLRTAEKTTLVKNLRRGALHNFRTLPLFYAVSEPVDAQRLINVENALATRLDAHYVDVLSHSAAANGTGSTLLVRRSDDADVRNSDSDVAYAFRTGRNRFSFGTIDGREYARAAIPFTNVDHQRYVLAVRKSVAEIPIVVKVVRQAFLYAALAGMALTLILGIPLSARLVRRLRRLREAALELAHQTPTVTVPVDRARDEVGDLARTLANMQKRLGQQEEARRSFVATASHELRTPLTSLDGMLELLDDDLAYPEPDLEDARALLGRARAQSRRLGRLAADLLDLSRIDARVELRSEAVELGELSRAVLAEFELGTSEHRIHCVLDDRGGPVWALGDPGSIARILRILLDNAVRISPPDSEISVVPAPGQPHVAVSVCDQGPGVRPEERDAIFRRFHRGRDTAGQAGFGLGLAIGRELAERMGGDLALEDRPPPGAVFTLRLPRAIAPAQDGAADGDQRSHLASHGGDWL
jgi:signal transduction histidine kinase